MQRKLEILEKQVKRLREREVFYLHWHDTMNSPLYKKIWWWLQGYKFFALGRWYKASWNESASKYED